jgi:exopolysaccharide production protein ExoQ
VTFAETARNGLSTAAAGSSARRGGMPWLMGRLESFITFFFLVTIAQICWPPDTYFLSLTSVDYSQPHLYDTLATSGLYGFLAVVGFVHRRTMSRLLRCAWPILALTLLALLSAYWSDDPLLVIRRTGSVLATTLFGIYLVARTDLGELTALLVKLYALAAAAAFAIFAVAPKLVLANNEVYTTAWQGAFIDKNELGMACALGVLFSVYALRRGYGPRLLAIFTIIASIVLLGLSQSRTPIVVIVAVGYVALVCAALRRRSGIGLIVGCLLFLIGIGAVVALAFDPAGALEALGRDPTLTKRVPLWHLVYGYSERRLWFGYGYDAFWRLNGPEANEIWAAIHWYAPHAHNAMLELALGLGIVGVGFGAFIWGTVITRFVRVATAPEAIHAVFWTALTAGIFVQNLTEYQFFRRGSMPWLLFVVAFVELGRITLARRAGRAADAASSAAARSPTPRRSQNKPVLA